MEVSPRISGYGLLNHGRCWRGLLHANGNQTRREWTRKEAKKATDIPGKIGFITGNEQQGQVTLDLRVYNGFGQLVKVSRDASEIRYSYRPDGLRHSRSVRLAHRKSNRTTLYLWDGQSIALKMNAGTDVTKKAYLRGAGLLAQQIDGNLSYYLHNAHGDVVQRTDASGRTLRKYTYNAFGCERAEGVRANNAWAAGGSSRAGNNGGGSASGRIVPQGLRRDGADRLGGAGSTSTSTDPNPFRYCGEYWDSDLQELYLRARTYNPQNGRFSQEDSARDGANWYSYCGGNPIRFSDPSGHKFADATESGGKLWYGHGGPDTKGQTVPAPAPGPAPVPTPRPPAPVVVSPVSHRVGSTSHIMPAPIAVAGAATTAPFSFLAFLAQLAATIIKLLLILTLIYAVVDFVSSLFDRPAARPQTSGPEKATESSSGFDKYRVPSSIGQGEASIGGTSPATPPPPDEDPEENPNFKLLRGSKLKNFLKNNDLVDEHGFKQEILGRRAPTDEFNIYVNANTKQIYLLGIQNGAVVPTGYYF